MEREDINLEQGSVRKLFWKYAIPSVVGMLIVSMQIMIDGLFLSYGVGSIGLAAVNLSMPLTNIFLSIALMVSIGGVVMTGIAYGEGREDRARSLTSLTFWVQNGIILLLSALYFLFKDNVITILGATDEVRPYVDSYLSIMMACSVFYNLPIYTEAFMRVIGRPNWVFISASICCLFNILLDYVFIIVFDMGMEGAAFGTCIANLIGGIVLMTQLRYGKPKFKISDIGNILYNGSSEMLTTVSAAVTAYAFNIVIMREIGLMGVSAMSIVFYVDTMVVITLYGLSQALQPIVSHNLGARNLPRIREVLKVTSQAGFTIGLISFIVMTMFSGYIISLFVHGDQELLALTKTAISFVVFSYLISFINVISSSFHTAIERPFESAVIALSRSLGFKLVLLLSLPLMIGVNGIWLSIPLAELCCLAVSLPLMISSMRRLLRVYMS